MLPVVAFVSCALHVCFRDIASTKKKTAQEREGRKGKLKKLSESARGLGGRAGAKEHRHVRFADEMTTRIQTQRTPSPMKRPLQQVCFV